MSSKKTIKGRLAISQVDKNRYFSISVKLLPTRENFPMTKISNDMRIKELKALAEFATGIPYHMQILRYLMCGNRCCCSSVCCLQFSLLFAVCKMSLFCTEINYSLMCSFNNNYLFKQINMVSFTQRNTSCTF